jgi:hypothetical protein
VGREFRFVRIKLKMDWEERKNKLPYGREKEEAVLLF